MNRPLPLLLLTLSLFMTSPSLAEDCKKAVDLYNEGALSDNLSQKETLYKKAIPLCSDPGILSRIYNNLADTHEKKNQYSKALLYYRKAIETKGDLATPYLSAGDIFYKLQDYYSAFIMYGKGLRYKPEDEEASKAKSMAEEGFTKKMVIYFDLDSTAISDLYVYRLQLVEGFVKNSPGTIQVEVSGHTCDLGSSAYNKKLSAKRADSVARYLAEKCSIPRGTIRSLGKGKANPLLPNGDEEARVLNRRVEITLSRLL